MSKSELSVASVSTVSACARPMLANDDDQDRRSFQDRIDVISEIAPIRYRVDVQEDLFAAVTIGEAVKNASDDRA